MLSPVTTYSLLKMHWSPEHVAQWPEQHLDVSSTTSPPSAHKHDPYAAAGRRGYAPAASYPWASDDISALTASSLLKHYAEKYSGLELPYERPAPGAYSEPGTFLKSEAEPWALGQGMECYPGLEALAAGAKVGSASVGLTGTGSVMVVSSNLTTDPGYSSSGSCNGPPLRTTPPPTTAPTSPQDTAPRPAQHFPQPLYTLCIPTPPWCPATTLPTQSITICQAATPTPRPAWHLATATPVHPTSPLG
ncbi:fidgetin-like [Coregonus clupeaformis]|uniref:fidgetin-like n=1 Tax=Coregonus clupeaformis TaxID=59861 RepID=UPI001E1C6840|nr:fidgetin-like [Coregonus clupeaformis]